MNDNKRIAKNTLLLYLRMMFTMIVSLYTSRIVLQNLGVEDYGLYQVVGGVVGLLSFLNLTLSDGSARFLMYGLGEGNPSKLNQLFSTLLSIHIILALFIVVIAETVGLWFVQQKLVIPEDRKDVALIVYHISILSAVFSITQPPYTASIKSHERMDIYAYTGITDTILKFIIVYLLILSPIDKLVFYAILLFIENVGMLLFLRYFCITHFPETKYKPQINKPMLKEVMGYSLWNLYYNIAQSLNTQGLLVMINLFFNAGVVTALSIANTVKGAVSTLVENFRVAVTPQIVKRYAAGDTQSSMNLVLSSTKYSFYLLFLLALPIFFVAPELIHLWLGIVPDYTVMFLRFIIIITIFHLFASCFYTALNAMGRIKENAIIRSTIYILSFPVIYILFKYGFSPIALSWVMLFTEGFLGLVVLPILIIKIGKYKMVDIIAIYKKCLFIVVLSLPLPLFVYINAGNNEWIRLFVISISCLISSVAVIWFYGLNKYYRSKVLGFVKQKFHHK